MKNAFSCLLRTHTHLSPGGGGPIVLHLANASRNQHTFLRICCSCLYLLLFRFSFFFVCEILTPRTYHPVCHRAHHPVAQMKVKEKSLFHDDIKFCQHFSNFVFPAFLRSAFPLFQRIMRFDHLARYFVGVCVKE